jgi:hypothetical protein
MARSSRLLMYAAAFAAMSALPIAAHATTVTYTDFSDTSALTLVGNAGTATTGDGVVLRVTPALGGQHGAAYSTTAVPLGASDIFSTQFQFRFTDPGGIDPADGITFVLAANPTGLGGGGGGIGYLGVPNSVAIEFDTFNNGESGTSNHVGVDTGGALQDFDATSPYGQQPCDFGGANYLRDGCMSNGKLWTANIGYDGTDLTVRLKQAGLSQELLITRAIDISSALGTTSAFVGFTSGTGAGFENHDIINWSFSDTTSLSGGVPEPATWALMLMGFGGLGAALRSRRRAATV